jgi:putative endonuclease
VKLAPLFNRKQAGDAAERVAEQYLQRQGLKLVERNYRTRHGEIDLIMREGAMLVFVEVRMRKNADFGGAGGSIGYTKQQRLIAAAHHYLAGIKPLPPCRFDAVLLNQPDPEHVEWIKDAFGA